MLLQFTCDVTVDVSDESRATVNETGVNLDQVGTGKNHLPSVLAVADSADADDRDLALELRV